jgi:hypothetical protein
MEPESSLPYSQTPTVGQYIQSVTEMWEQILDAISTYQKKKEWPYHHVSGKI